MTFYAAYPVCGHKLCKGENGSQVDILCPRCGRLIKIIITEKDARTIPIEKDKDK